MSAYVVDRAHIAYLVEAAARLGRHHNDRGLRWVFNVNREAGTYEYEKLALGDYEAAARIGQILWSENVRSVSHRYPNDRIDQLPGPIGCTYEYGPHRSSVSFNHDPVAVLKACDGYEYQACEHPEWEASEAHAFIQALRRKAISCLKGYDEASWEVHS